MSALESKYVDSIPKLIELGVSLEPIKVTKLLELVQSTTSVFVNSDGIMFTSNLHDPVCSQVRNILRTEMKKFSYFTVSDSIMRYIKTNDASNTKVKNKPQLKVYEASTDKQDMFYVLIESAKDSKAADVKILFSAEDDSHVARIFFRLNGRLVQQKQFNYTGKALLAMMRAAINHDAAVKGDAAKQFNEAIPNDASTPVTLSDGTEISIRVGSLPGVKKTVSVSLRILAVGTMSETITLKQLGFLDEQIVLIEDALKSPYGAIFFTGPTGSGKTTSIAAGLSLVDDCRSIITLENPVENQIDKPAIIQCSVNEENPDLTWERLLRAALRNDPDVIMIGEIRDKSVAKTATRAASTGHLVLTTLHVNSSLEIPSALKYYGLSPLEIAERNFLRLLCAQRLVPKLCSNCKIPLNDYSINTNQVQRLKKHFQPFLDSVFVENKKGCSNCNHQGVAGRALISEVLKIDSRAREFIRSEDTDAWYRHLVSKGWHDMKYHAEKLVIQGLICPLSAEGEVSTPFGVNSHDDEFNYNELRVELNG